VKFALHNVFLLLLREEGTTGDLSGDVMGYSVKWEAIIALIPRRTTKKRSFLLTD